MRFSDRIMLIARRLRYHAAMTILTLLGIILAVGLVTNASFFAEGVDRVVKIHSEQEMPPTPRAEAAIFAEALEGLEPDLVFIGSRAPDELEGMLGPSLAVALGWPYAGGIHGVHPCLMETRVQAFKEFPGDVLARMSVRLPAVLGILAAERTPRYVPVGNIREVMTTVEMEELEIAARETEPTATVRWLHTAKP